MSGPVMKSMTALATASGKSSAIAHRGRSGYDEFVGLIAHFVGVGRSARTASTPRTTSPDSTAAEASTNARIAS